MMSIGWRILVELGACQLAVAGVQPHNIRRTPSPKLVTDVEPRSQETLEQLAASLGNVSLSGRSRPVRFHLQGLAPREQHHSHSSRVHGQRAEGQKAHSLIDGFVVVYWGCVALTIAALYAYMQRQDLESLNASIEGCASPDSLGSIRKTSSITDAMFQETLDLSENLWALVLVVALGNAKTRSGGECPMWLIAVPAFLMGTLQLMVLFLMIHDLDPRADPMTTVPSASHGSAATVNAMKVAMSIIMLVALVGEAGQCQRILHVTLCVDREHLKVPRWVPLGFGAFQYMIAIIVVHCSMSVILSFQSVTSIVYSSMSLLCIIHVDEMFLEAFRIVFKFKAEFTVAEELVTKKTFSLGYHFFARFLCIFPVLWGIQLFSRAWYTGILPTTRLQELMDSWLH